MSEAMFPIAVIGAGFSGTVTALHLMKSVPGRRILLCERGPTFARGAAYSTEDPVHLLNVRASNMSAFPDRPGHFLDWLSAQGELPSHHVHETPAGQFVSRAVYGRYLSALLQDELACPEGASRLRIIPEEAVALARKQDGSFELSLAGGRSHQVAGAIVAVGNLLNSEQGASGPCVRDPWSVRFKDGLRHDAPVVVIGTGLTMVDIVTSLWTSGFAGPVLAVSRHGLLPRTHVAPAPWPLAPLEGAGRSQLSSRLRVLRREVERARIAGLPWQSVVDALRPITGALWRGLAPEQQARFIRHLRPWWDAHRHRMAPPVAEQLHALMRQGRLRIVAGRILSVVETGERSVAVRWRVRGSTDEQSIEAQRVVYATGSPSVAATRDTLLDRMMGAGLARMDSHGLGLEATADLRLVGQDGEAIPGLWAIGPIVRGSFWECTAVPDIRSDAQRLAREVDAQFS